MGLLSGLEEMIESVFENGVASLMRSRLQPVEIAKKLAKAMENHQSIGVGKTYVPNNYAVHLGPSDYAVFAPGKGGYERDLSDYLVNFARQRGYALKSRPTVQLIADQTVGKRQVRISARLLDTVNDAELDDPRATNSGYTTRLNITSEPIAKPAAAAPLPSAHLVINEGAAALRYPIDHMPFSVGRALDNDVVVDDRRVSRHHVQIREMNQRYFLVDLDSTNGTFVNGERVTRCVLKDKDVISLGGMQVVLSTQGQA
ncbi:MAG: DUF2662 domain-containing protein [Chloroflexota bacterium]|nr:MAG: DUF2662 domain-containing protein [Chloroflexota bacterium]